jgi:hypothetical protein
MKTFRPNIFFKITLLIFFVALLTGPFWWGDNACVNCKYNKDVSFTFWDDIFAFLVFLVIFGFMALFFLYIVREFTRRINIDEYKVEDISFFSRKIYARSDIRYVTFVWGLRGGTYFTVRFSNNRKISIADFEFGTKKYNEIVSMLGSGVASFDNISKL